MADYLDSKNEENQEKHETFLRMLDEVKISDIEKIEQEQQQINKKIPFKVRYSGNYLWQIYYSEENDKYFMIVPTEDKDYSTFFYVLKKQIEKKKAGKVFVPISNVDYSRELLNKTEIQSLENYLWLFTKDWPSIYEVYDKTEKVSLQIIGETEVYGKIKSQYKVKLSNKIEATKFFKLVKALFILQSELPTYYKFKTQIDKQGSLQFYYEDEVLEYDDLADWINDEYKRLLKIEIDCVKENNNLQARLKKLKEQTEGIEHELKRLDIEKSNAEKDIDVAYMEDEHAWARVNDMLDCLYPFGLTDDKEKNTAIYDRAFAKLMSSLIPIDDIKEGSLYVEPSSLEVVLTPDDNSKKISSKGKKSKR